MDNGKLLPGLMLLVLLGIAASLVIAGGVDEVGNSTGFDHADHEDMRQGGPGELRQRGIFFWGSLFGVLQITFFVLCLALGAARGGRLGGLVVPLLVGGGIYVATFILLVAVYRNYMTGSDSSLIFSFPPPTAIMLFGIGLVPALFMVFYVAGFDRWILTADDLEKFNKIVGSRGDVRGEEK